MSINIMQSYNAIKKDTKQDITLVMYPMRYGTLYSGLFYFYCICWDIFPFKKRLMFSTGE